MCLFNISHFSSIECSEVMSKRMQKDLGEERVTVKSKPMMNLVSRCSERTLVVLPSTASESPGQTRHESQSPLGLQTEKYDRTGRPVENAHSSSYSEWNVDKTWSSQEWKSDELMEDRTVRPVVNAQHTDKFVVENDEMNSYTEAESELSLESRSFLHKMNDQVRKRQNQSSKDATKDSDKHSVMWGMFMSSTLQASVFMGKNCSDNWHSIKNTEDLTMKQMFDISEKFITEQSDEAQAIWFEIVVKQCDFQRQHLVFCVVPGLLAMTKCSFCMSQNSQQGALNWLSGQVRVLLKRMENLENVSSKVPIALDSLIVSSPVTVQGGRTEIYGQIAPVFLEYIAPQPAACYATSVLVAFAAPAPVVEHISPAPAVCAALVRVVKYVDLAALVLVVEHISPDPTVYAA